MADAICDPTSPSYPKWTAFDAVMWKLMPESRGGGTVRLFNYKDAWVKYNAARIKSAAAAQSIPPLLLACVAWNEAGGMPDFVKGDIVFQVRSFDWSGPDWVDKHMTITRNPALTSFGGIAMQLRVAAHELGLDATTMSYSEQSKLGQCLETDAFNIDVVAKYLHDLILYDYPGADTANLTDEQFVIAGSRYNRGTQRSLADMIASNNAPVGSALREYTSYGHAMLRHRDRVANMLGSTP